MCLSVFECVFVCVCACEGVEGHIKLTQLQFVFAFDLRFFSGLLFTFQSAGGIKNAFAAIIITHPTCVAHTFVIYENCAALCLILSAYLAVRWR